MTDGDGMGEALAGEVLAPDRNQKGQFRRGNRFGKGRAKGVLNRTTQNVKEVLLEAAACRGYDGQGEGGLPGFFAKVAETDPTFVASAIVRSCVSPAKEGEPPGEGGGSITAVTIL